jgi:hypothetical protein
MRRYLAALTLVIAACGDDDSTDSGGRSHEDASARHARADAGEPPQLNDWDGGELPELRWTLPECAVDHGVLARNVLTPEQRPDLPLSLLALALGRERVVASWIGNDEQWGELRDGAFEPFASVADSFGIERAPQRISIAEDRVLGLTYLGGDHLPLLVEWLHGTLLTKSLEDLAGSEGQLSLRAAPELPDNGWVDLQAGEDGSLQIVGEWALSTDAPSGRTDLARVTLDAEHRVQVPAEWYEHEPNADYTRPPQPRAFVRAGEGSAAVLQWGSPGSRGQIDVVVHTPEGQRSVRIDPAEHGSDRGISDLSAALDGDVITLGWLGSVHDVDGIYELTAEVPVDAAAQMRPLGRSGLRGLTQSGMRYLDHPGGGVDVLKFGTFAPGYFYDSRNRADNPLALYLGVRRPLRFDRDEPLRIGAGGTAWQALAARDGGRIAVLWLEHGPATSERYSEAHTVQGIYYAVLECD